jgi:hypothetical protein
LDWIGLRPSWIILSRSSLHLYLAECSRTNSRQVMPCIGKIIRFIMKALGRSPTRNVCQRHCPDARRTAHCHISGEGHICRKFRFNYTILYYTTPYTTLYQESENLKKPGFTTLCYTTLRQTLHYMGDQASVIGILPYYTTLHYAIHHHYTTRWLV